MVSPSRKRNQFSSRTITMVSPNPNGAQNPPFLPSATHNYNNNKASSNCNNNLPLTNYYVTKNIITSSGEVEQIQLLNHQNLNQICLPQSPVSSSSSFHIINPTSGLSFEIDHPDQVDNKLLVQQSLINNNSNSIEDFVLRSRDFGDMEMERESTVMNPVPPIMAADWLQYHLASVQNQIHEQEQEQITAMAGLSYDQKLVLDVVGYSESETGMKTAKTTSLDSMASVAQSKRRRSDDSLEKSIERRQRRMIKNRESAARSRARKQV